MNGGEARTLPWAGRWVLLAGNHRLPRAPRLDAPADAAYPAAMKPAFIEKTVQRVALAALATSIAIPATASRPSAYPISAVPFTEVRLTDAFWAPRLETNRTVTIPFGFKKSEEEGRLRNFERAAHVLAGPYEGKMPFDDTDVYKLIEGASYSLQSHPDPELERYLGGIIAKIAAAQEPDGYLTTYKTIDPTKSPAPWLKPGPRWELELQGSHELYNSGHLYEAAYAHFRATGKRTLLDVALKNADLIGRVFGPGKRMTPPGHQIIETGLIKLAAATGDDRYRALARFFLDQRGNAAGHKLFGPYNQDHAPVVEQHEAVGHAVRAAYMYSAMADVATLDDDPLYRAATQRIWEDVVTRKLYLTGAIGARHEGEAFGDAFELPNRTAYGETCASIASVYWNQRLFLQSGDAKYVDLLERTLYNAAIAGVSLKGDTFFYPNPLESDGRYAFNQGALTRKPWFDCSCCPTNLARFIPSIPDYIYAAQKDTLFVNLFVASEASVDLGGAKVALAQRTAYPWDGHIELRLTPERARTFEVRVRIPGWARGTPVPSDLYRYDDRAAEPYALRVNGQAVNAQLTNGYAVVNRTWAPGDVITLDLPMPVRRVVADERVADDKGKVAIERGPLVYCVEGADNDNSVLDLVVPDSVGFAVERRADLLAGVTVLRASVSDRAGRPRHLTAIPYYAWSNRGAGEMAVWLGRSTGAGVWSIDNTTRIGGHALTTLGAPRVEATELGAAVRFGGASDGLILPVNPLEGLAQFTFEILFKPEAGGLPEQRFVHCEVSGLPDRAMIETRLTPDGQWHLDTYLRTGTSGQTLNVPTALHPVDRWYWAALTYDGHTMRHFVDGRLEASADFAMSPLGPGRMGLGVRLNQVSWFKGLVREIRVHPVALTSEQLQRPAR
jgi:uncharacterized protein